MRGVSLIVILRCPLPVILRSTFPSRHAEARPPCHSEGHDEESKGHGLGAATESGLPFIGECGDSAILSESDRRSGGL